MSHSVVVDADVRALSAALSSLEGWLVSPCQDGWQATRGPDTVLLVPAATGVRVTWSAGVSRAVISGVLARGSSLTGAPVIVGTAIVRGTELLAQQRAYPPSTAGLWELPGGRVEPGESDVDAVRRECEEELGVTVRVGDPVGPDVALPGGKVLRIYAAALDPLSPEPHPHDHQALRWLTVDGLDSVEWLPADRVLLPSLRALLLTQVSR
jgi:mutator protein MutT